MHKRERSIVGAMLHGKIQVKIIGKEARNNNF